MRYWRLSVKNRTITFYLPLLGLIISCILVVIGCQTAQLAPYTKYTSDAEVPRISLEDAKKDYDAGNVVIIDSRSDIQYNQEHIAGSMPISKIGPVEENYSGIPKGKKIIVYCS
jgi:Rhodanese-like domain